MKAADFDRADFRARTLATNRAATISGPTAPDMPAEESIEEESTATPPHTGDALVVADALTDMGWSREQVGKMLAGPAKASIHEVVGKLSAGKPSAAVTSPAPRAEDWQIVDNAKRRLRAAFLKLVPGYLQALIAQAQPSPEEKRRYDDYKRSKDFLKAAEAIEGAVTVLVTAINPLAGAAVGVAVAGVSATQEALANDIDRYIAPWEKKDAGLTGAYALSYMRRWAYSYRGFTSVGYSQGTATQATFGISLNSPGLAALEDAFDDYIDGLLVQAGKALKIEYLHRYFPVNLVTEQLPVEERDNERILRYPDGSRDNNGRIIAQYVPAELEAISAEVAKAK
jgi:hypothetical protein